MTPAGSGQRESFMNRPAQLAGCAIGCIGFALLTIAVTVIGYGTRREWLPVLAYALNVQSSLRPADVIIVLGGGDGDREDYGSQLYRQGLAGHVIATGAPAGTDTEALDLVRHGVPRAAIILANGTQNTHEDALRSRQLMQDHHWHTALLVTDRFHIRRSLWTFRTAFDGDSLEVRPAPVVGGWFDAGRWWQTDRGFVAVNDEYLKLIYYFVRGFITPSAALQG